MTARELVATLQREGFTLRPVDGGKKLRIIPGSRLTEELTEQLRRHKPEVLRLLAQQPSSPRPASPRQPGTRAFLSRPLGQENNPDAWDAWVPFMLWLLEHHSSHYYLVCAAEDAISALERQGIAQGVEYEAACQTLRQRFETARKLALREQGKVWWQ